jgi:hypothetical protein
MYHLESVGDKKGVLGEDKQKVKWDKNGPFAEGRFDFFPLHSCKKIKEIRKCTLARWRDKKTSYVERIFERRMKQKRE